MHQSTMAEEKAVTREMNTEISTEKVEQILRRMPKGFSRSIRRGQLIGAWLTVLPSIVNGTELSSEEFRDALTIHYCELPCNFPLKCDGCDAPFTCKRVVLSSSGTTK
jgi:hypothetical protein